VAHGQDAHATGLGEVEGVRVLTLRAFLEEHTWL
jgi:hypothetical protein